MEKIPLQFYKSRLGFGTSLLTRSSSVNEAILNLEEAYNCGITHFDTAKLYGFGYAEELLGKFAKGKRSNISITSKSGLNSNKIPLIALPVVNKMRKILNFVTRNRNKELDHNSQLVKGHFNPSKLHKDIEDSLRKISTDYIDFYLLHESDVSEANRFDLIDVLEKAKFDGKILHYGIASNYFNIANDISFLDSRHEVIQHNVSLLNCENNKLFIKDNSRLRILYNVFSDLKRVSSELKYIELGFNNPVEYILSQYKKINQSGTTLFASTNSKNIKNTAKIWESIKL